MKTLMEMLKNFSVKIRTQIRGVSVILPTTVTLLHPGKSVDNREPYICHILQCDKLAVGPYFTTS